jgi:adenylylsulfate kinase
MTQNQEHSTASSAPGPGGFSVARAWLHGKTARARSWKRSVVKALTYRAVIICLDFLCIYLFTGKIKVALGFMIVSNLYTTIGYFVHERIWAHIPWGMTAAKAAELRHPPATASA